MHRLATINTLYRQTYLQTDEHYTVVKRDLKQNTDTACNSLRLVSASLVYLFAIFACCKAVSGCFGVLFQFYFRMCDGLYSSCDN